MLKKIVLNKFKKYIYFPRFREAQERFSSHFKMLITFYHNDLFFVLVHAENLNRQQERIIIDREGVFHVYHLPSEYIFFIDFVC